MTRLTWVCVGIGVVVLVAIAVTFGVKGVLLFGMEDFGPSFYAAVVGVATTASLALLLVILTLVIEHRQMRKKLSGTRLKILATTGRDFTQSLLNYLNVLGIDSRSLNKVSNQSWRSTNQKSWPSKADWKYIKKVISTATLPSSFQGGRIRDAFAQLHSAVTSIANLATIPEFFSGHESLASKAVLLDLSIFPAWRIELDNLGLDIKPGAIYPMPNIVLQHLQKAASESCDILLGLIKIAKEVQFVQGVPTKETRMVRIFGTSKNQIFKVVRTFLWFRSSLMNERHKVFKFRK